MHILFFQLNVFFVSHAYHRALVYATQDSKADEPTYTSCIWGPTCCGFDCIIKECRLPCLETGEWLVFKNMGAYTMCLATTFNGMPKPDCHYVIQQHDLCVSAALCSVKVFMAFPVDLFYV